MIYKHERQNRHTGSDVFRLLTMQRIFTKSSKISSSRFCSIHIFFSSSTEMCLMSLFLLLNESEGTITCFVTKSVGKTHVFIVPKTYNMCKKEYFCKLQNIIWHNYMMQNTKSLYKKQKQNPLP